MARAGVIFIGIIALLGAIGGLIIGAGITFLGWRIYGDPQTNLLLYLYLLASPSTPHWFQSYIMIFLIPESFRLMSIATWVGYFGAGVLIVSFVYLATAIGLFAMKNWARILMIIIGVLYLLGGIGMTIFGGITLNILLILWGLVNLLWGIILVAYLNGDVKHEFE